MINKQAKNAGNRGDILKHVVLLEILDCATRNNIWSYRESHAGAGYYELNENSEGLKTFLTESVENLKKKKAAVLMIWTSYIQRSHNKTYDDLKRYIKENSPENSLARHFVTTRGKDGETYYWVSVIGFGAGVKIVNSLPYDWSKSWLASNDVNTLIKEFKS